MFLSLFGYKHLVTYCLKQVLLRSKRNWSFYLLSLQHLDFDVMKRVSKRFVRIVCPCVPPPPSKSHQKNFDVPNNEIFLIHDDPLDISFQSVRLQRTSFDSVQEEPRAKSRSRRSVDQILSVIPKRTSFRKEPFQEQVPLEIFLIHDDFESFTFESANRRSMSVDPSNTPSKTM